jgi:hypothetical protein
MEEPKRANFFNGTDDIDIIESDLFFQAFLYHTELVV